MSDLTTTVQRVLDLDREATPGPWETDGVYDCYVFKKPVGNGVTVADNNVSHDDEAPEGAVVRARGTGAGLTGTQQGTNMRLTAEYRTAAPVLARAVTALEAQLAAMKEHGLGNAAAIVKQARDAEADRDALRADLDRVTEEESRAWAVLTGEAWTQTRPEGSLLAAAERVVADLARVTAERDASERLLAEARGEIAGLDRAAASQVAALASARAEAAEAARQQSLDYTTRALDDAGADPEYKASRPRTMSLKRQREIVERERDALRADLARVTAAEASARQEAEGLRAALWIIEKWDSFPRVRDPDRPNATMSYRVAYGSNGERDFMRDVARAALSAPAPVPATPVSAIHNVGKPCPVCSGCDVCLGTGRAPHYVPAPVPATPAVTINPTQLRVALDSDGAPLLASFDIGTLNRILRETGQSASRIDYVQVVSSDATPAPDALDPPQNIGAEDAVNPRPPKGTILDANGRVATPAPDALALLRSAKEMIELLGSDTDEVQQELLAKIDAALAGRA